MAITQKQYDLFKSECEKWIKVFELSSFEIRFFWEKLDDNLAEVRTGQVSKGIIEVYFTKELKDNIDYIDDNYIKMTAKHEAIHCLVAEITEAGWDRFTTKDELIKLEEKLVNKLIKIIK